MSASPNVTLAQQNALSIALTRSHVFQGRPSERDCASRCVIEGLVAAGLLKWRERGDPNRWNWPTAVLTDEGRGVALTLPDRESSASRQHYVDHNRYLKYGDRPEFAPTPQIPELDTFGLPKVRRFKVEIYRDDMLIASKVLTSGNSYLSEGIAFRSWLIDIGFKAAMHDRVDWSRA
jgi:hypothetical protein